VVAVALAVALALGGTLDAAEIVTAAVEPAVAVTSTGADALAEAEALPPDACARAADADNTTVTATAASNRTAARGNDCFLLDSTSHSSFSSGSPSTLTTVTEATIALHHPNGLVWRNRTMHRRACEQSMRRDLDLCPIRTLPAAARFLV
jgi:hypothetical protein